MNYHNKKQKRVNRNTLKTHKKQPNLNKTNQMMAAEKDWTFMMIEKKKL